MIRPATQDDVQTLGAIAENAGLVPAEYMPDMIAPAFDGGQDTWLVADNEGAVGFAFARPEEMADRVWNILAIAVNQDARGSGRARELLHAMEGTLAARLIIIDTTQRDEQAAARAFYEKEGYRHIASVPDFYAAGEDKLTYCKVMP